MVQWYETRWTKGALEILTSKIIWFLANVLVKPVFTARLTAKTRLNIDSNRNIRYSYMTLDEIISSVYDIPSSTQITTGISIWNQKMKPIYGLYKLYRLDKGNFKIGVFPTYGLWICTWPEDFMLKVKSYNPLECKNDLADFVKLTFRFSESGNISFGLSTVVLVG